MRCRRQSDPLRRGTNPPGRRVRWVATLVIAAAALYGCSPGALTASQDDEPLADAEAWVQAYWDAGSTRVQAQAPFLSAGVVDDLQAILEVTHDNRWDTLEGQRQWFGDSLDEITREAMYLDVDGVLWPETAELGQRSDLAMAIWAEVGPDGIETLRHFSATTQAWDHAAIYPDFRDPAHELAARYEQAWTSGDGDLLASLYSPDATFTDRLAGTGLDGAAAIVERSEELAGRIEVDRAAEHHASLTEPLGKAPAAYAYGASLDAPVSQVWLLAHSVEPCPGDYAIELTVDGARITAERWLHTPDSIRACLADRDLPDGWWTDRDLPILLADRVTGTIDTGGRAIEVRNGSPELDEAVRSALDRFERAGLLAPTVASIAFDPYDPRCDDFQGYAEWSESATAILVCVDSDGTAWRNLSEDADMAGRFTASDLLLHELGHAWLAAHLSEPAQSTFIDHAGVTSWNDKAEPPAQRGVEWAAETLSWGLGGALQTEFAFTSPPCETLADGFRILTGTEPLTTCAKP